MAKSDAVLTRMREICLSLPDTKETMTWGKPHFRVGEKIFAGCGEEDGRQVIGFKLQMAHAETAIKDPRFWRAPYVGSQRVGVDGRAQREGLGRNTGDDPREFPANCPEEDAGQARARRGGPAQSATRTRQAHVNR